VTSESRPGPIGVITAMPDEAADLLAAFTSPARVTEHGRREFLEGELEGRAVVVVVSRCGKVSAAATATELIVRFGVDEIICTGVAGGIGEGVGIGDVVVADALMQHDFDARPIWPRYVIPFLEVGRFPCDGGVADRLERAAREAIETDGPLRGVLGDNAESARVHRGLVVSGDQFIDSAAEVKAITAALPESLAVEMEGAAIAQVAHEYGVPVGVVRAISDRADDDAAGDYTSSLGRFAAAYSHGVVTSYLRGPV